MGALPAVATALSCSPAPARAAALSRRASSSSGPIARRRRRNRATAAKLHVPDDTFGGGRSPEQRASQSLTNLITAVAIRIVLAQLGGGGEGGDLPPAPQFGFLRAFLDERPLAGDPEAWLTDLLARDQMLGVRIMEVREAYCAELNWAQLQELTAQGIRDSNVALMRQHAARAFGGSLSPDPPQPAEGGS